MKIIRNFLEKYNIFWHRKHEDSSTARFWFSFKETTVNIEYNLFNLSNSFRICMYLNGISNNGGVTLSFGVFWLLSLFISINNPKLNKKLPSKIVNSIVCPGEKFKLPITKKIGVSIYDGYIWFSFYENPMESSRSDPWWWSFNFNYIDFLLGESKVTTNISDTGKTLISLPEGNCNIKYKREVITRKRPRWVSDSFTRYRLDMDDNPIPIPGKGENCYDIDDDAIYSRCVLANSLQEAIEKLTVSVYRYRVSRDD